MSTERPSASTAAASPPAFRRILGVPFYTGDLAGLLALTQRGGLIVVPSAPVLVELPASAAHRAALEGADLAVTDSGLMVWLWFFRTGERLHRISGLKYLRALLEEPDFRGTSAPPPAPTAPPSSFDSRPSTSSPPLSTVSSPAIPTRDSLLAPRSCHSPQPSALGSSSPTFWVMPSARDAEANIAWLRSKGVMVSADDCYLAPQYPAGPLRDPVLLDAIKRRQPRYIVLCVGGGVQERLGWYLKQALSEAPPSALPPSLLAPSIPPSSLDPRPSASVHPPPLPAIICTGAAIAFLSGRQVNIPPWADRYVLGWLFRCLKEPGKFLPRYWKALRLVPLLLRHRDRGVMDGA